MKPRREKGPLRPVEKFEMRQFREAGMSIKDCASYFGVSLATAMRGLADMREKFGLERLPRARRQLARAHLSNGLRGANMQVDNAEKPAQDAISR